MTGTVPRSFSFLCRLLLVVIIYICIRPHLIRFLFCITLNLNKFLTLMKTKLFRFHFA